MLFLIALILAFGFAFLCGGTLKKHPNIFYSAAVLLTVGMSFLPSVNTRDLPLFVNIYVLGLFTRGAFATALWCVVMITGALPNGSAPMKKFMPIRGELSIFAALLTLGHNIGYGRTYFVMLFTNRERMSDNQLYASFCTIAMLCIMIPLTIMSFPKIRKKMSPKLWKNIQRTAYIFYALIYVHVMLLTLPMARSGRRGYTFSVFMYTIVFFGYAFFRIRKFALKKNKSEKRIVVNAAFTFTVLMISFVTISAMPKEKKNENSGTNKVKSFSVSATLPANSVVTTAAEQVISNGSISTTTADSSVIETTLTESGETAETTGTTCVTSGENNSTETTASSEKNDQKVTETAAVTGEATTSASAETAVGTTVLVSEKNEPPTEAVTTAATSKAPTEPATNAPSAEKPTSAEKPVVPVTEPPTEPQYIYNNGEFSASAYGYDGDVFVTVTIENDIITNISGYSEESDEWYFDSAAGQVIPAILSSQSADVDAFSGATYSSEAIMSAVKKALSSARK